MLKIEYLNGLKGIFAVSVVVYHFLLIFLFAVFSGDKTSMHLGGCVEKILFELPQFLYNGNCAVCVFFVLSGFLLSMNFWQERQTKFIVNSACKRYIRLTGPVLMSTLLMWGLLKIGWVYNHEISAIAKSAPLIDMLYRFDFTLLRAIKEALWGVYFSYGQIESYNPVLWTMEIELKGSFLAFSFLLLFGNLKRRWIFYIIMIAIFLKTYYLAFLLGMMLSDIAYSTENKKYWKLLTEKKMLNCFLFLLAIVLSSYVADQRNLVFSALRFDFFERMHFDSEAFYHILGGFFLVYTVLQFQWLKNILSNRMLLLLGKYSFSLYLIHVPILLSWSGKVFLFMLENGYSYEITIIVVFFSSLPLIALGSFLLYRYVDLPCSVLAKKIQGILTA